MKKFAFVFFLLLASLQANYATAAITSFSESVLEIDAILEATQDPEFSSLFKTSDFITSIVRVTRDLDTIGEIKYNLRTRNIRTHRIKDYRVVLDISPNPGIGPKIITVESIRRRAR